MDPFHERLARIGLGAVRRYGFCLAGGYAVQAHGFIERRSEDVDLFTTADGDLPAAVDALADALRREGLAVAIVRRSPTFARLDVTDPGNGANAPIELGVDWRRFLPADLDIGPVLHADDAVANKVCALFGRGELRDYVDVDAIVGSGRYSVESLLALAADHDPGFDTAMFADALRAVRRFAPTAFATYGLSPDDAEALVARVLRLADQI